jgi:diguanylate cyclase (GGDEF)-like protein
MSGLHFVIIFFQCWNTIALGFLLRYAFIHRRQSLSGFTEFALMTGSLLLSSVLFTAAIIDEFSRVSHRFFCIGIALFFFAHAFYTLMAARMFNAAPKLVKRLYPVLLAVPLFLLAASFFGSAVFFPPLPEGASIRFDLTVTPLFLYSFAYFFAVYVITVIASLRSKQEYLLHNKTVLTLAVLVPIVLPVFCVLLESLFPRQVFGIAAAAHFLLPLVISYCYWGYFTSSRRSMVEGTGALYVIFDVFGACADSNYACREFFKERHYGRNDISLRTLSNITGISASELLTMQSSIFHDGNQKYYQIERFTAQLPYAGRVNSTGYWIRDITVHKEKEMHLLDLVDKDPLTNVYSRRFFYTYFDELKNDTANTGKNMTLLILDIDFFKRVNDTYGHVAGDEVLRVVCSRAENCLRAGDILCRFGGEEFVMLLHTDDARDGKEIADRVLTAMSANAFVLHTGDRIPVTVSIGGASFALTPDWKLSEVLQQADEKLYAAKHNNRNQVVF